MPRRSAAKPGIHTVRMHIVYILESADRCHSYVGVTNNLERRLAEHNRGKSEHTSKHKPWKVHVYIAFTDRKGAEQFEKYLKSHSGRAFMKRHFWSLNA